MCVQWLRVLTWNGSSYGSPKCTFTSTFQWKQTRVNVALQKWWNTALCWGCRVFWLMIFILSHFFFFLISYFCFFLQKTRLGWSNSLVRQCAEHVGLWRRRGVRRHAGWAAIPAAGQRSGNVPEGGPQPGCRPSESRSEPRLLRENIKNSRETLIFPIWREQNKRYYNPATVWM